MQMISPIVNISDANFWKTANDLELYVNNFYDRSDLLNGYTNWGSIGPYGADADNGVDTQVDEPWDQVKGYVGEALFFRSIFYFT